MTSLNALFLWLLTAFGTGPSAGGSVVVEHAPLPPSSNLTGDDDDDTEEPDWLDIHLRLLRNGKDSIFNGV